MMGLETKIKDARSPFHSARGPSLLIRSLAALRMGTLFSACFVFKTQKGFVAIADTHPDEPEHLVMLVKEFGSKPNTLFAWA